MLIHREGRVIILTTLIILFIIGFGLYMLFPLAKAVRYPIYGGELLLFFFIVRFFRNPNRKIVKDDSTLYCPADGKVVVIEKVVDEEYSSEEALQVSIFMSVWNVHSNKYPCNGLIKYVQYHPGAFHLARHPKASMLNEMNCTIIEHKKGFELMIKQIAGAMARRIITYAKTGTAVTQGDELGFIRFGSRVDILLPPDTDVKVKIGDSVRSGISVLAKV